MAGTSLSMVDVNDYLGSVAQIAQNCPGVTLRRAYVRAMRMWCTQTMWLRMSIPGATVAAASLTTPAGAQNNVIYTLGKDVDIEIISIEAVRAQTPAGVTPVQYWALDLADPTQWDANQLPNTPSKYAYVVEGQLAVFPPPDKVYPLLVSANVQPKETAVRIPEAPLLRYRDVFEAGALGYLLNIPGQKWSNPNLATKYEKTFSAGVANGKAEVQRAYNTGSTRARLRNFLR